MKFLYVALDPVEKGADLERAVLHRLAGVRQLGYQADCIYYNIHEMLYIRSSGTKNIALPETPVKKDRMISDFICSVLKESAYDYLYLKGLFLSFACLEYAQCAKREKFSTKVIYEPERYPLKEYCRGLIEQYREVGSLLECVHIRRRLLHHNRCLRHLNGLLDTVVIPDEPVTELWGVPALTVSEGVSVGAVPVRTRMEDLADPIAMLAVMERPDIFGFERVLKGLRAYQSNLHRDAVTFDIVGSGPVCDALEQRAREWNLEPFVRFLGPKTENEICELCQSHTAAVSSLGLFCAGKIYYSERITRIYCASGIPFLYAYEDLSLGGRLPFTLKLANMDTPVSIELVAEFVWRCRLNPHLAQTERKFAEKYYDWRVIMKRILEFTATGRREA